MGLTSVKLIDHGIHHVDDFLVRLSGNPAFFHQRLQTDTHGRHVCPWLTLQREVVILWPVCVTGPRAVAQATAAIHGALATRQTIVAFASWQINDKKLSGESSFALS